MVGAAIATATQIDNISVAELISDWQTLISQAQTYKTDVNGILALYNTMMRKEDQMGLGGVPVSVAKSITSTVTAWKASLDLGLKAKLMETRMPGKTAAERALGFEDLGYGEQLQSFMEYMQRIVGPGIAEGSEAAKAAAKVRVRRMAERFEFPSDVQKHLADAVVEGKITSKQTEEMNKKYEEAQERIAKSEKLWNEQRGYMIRYAGKTAAYTKSIQDLIQQYAADFAAKYLQPVVNWLSEIWSAISKLWEDPEQKMQRIAMEELTKSMSPAQASYALAQVMREHGKPGGALDPGRKFEEATGWDLIKSYAVQQGGGGVGTGAAMIGGLGKWVFGDAEEQRAKYRAAATYATATRRVKEIEMDPEFGPMYRAAAGSPKRQTQVLNDYIKYRGGAKTPVASSIPGGSGTTVAGGKTPTGSFYSRVEGSK
jgi:hypothetical protein